MDPALAAALAQYLAANCAGSISLHCGPGGPAPAPGGCQCPSRVGRAPEDEWGEGCASICPEPDYSDPEQPYFWDHTTMSN